MSLAKIINVKQNSGSVLARLLAAENIHVRYQGQTVYFDLQNRILNMPIWKDISRDLQDMLLAHETGHALYTPVSGWDASINKLASLGAAKGIPNIGALKLIAKDCLNVVEDIRIDKLQKRKYPGVKINYVRGCKELFDRDFFGLKEKDLDINDLGFVDRCNIYFKGGYALGMKFSDDELALMKRLADLETWDDTVVLATELFMLRLEEIENNKKEEEKSEPRPGSNGGNKSESKSKDKSEDKKPSKSESKKSDDAADGNATASEGDDSEKGTSSEASDAAGAVSTKTDTKSEIEVSSKDRAVTVAREKSDEYKSLVSVVGSTAYESPVIQIAPFTDANLDRILDHWKRVMKQQEGWQSQPRREHIRESFRRWKDNENKTISFLVKEFETRKAASTYAKQQIAVTGVLDSNRLHAYRYSDDIFRKNLVVPKGKNHGFVLFLDWSSSMKDNMHKTVLQLLTLVLFCKRLNIPFEVYAFRDVIADIDTRFSSSYSALDGFRLRNILSSDMPAAVLNEQMYRLYGMSLQRDYPLSDRLTMTPLNQTILAAPKLLERFRKKHRTEINSVIFLTDGDSTGYNVLNSQNSSSIIVDKETRESFNANDFRLCPNESRRFTAILLQNLKRKIGSDKIVGFFIPTNNARQRVHDLNEYLYTGSEEKAKYDKLWIEEGYCDIDQIGYDKHFFIDPARFNEDNLFGEKNDDNVKDRFMLLESFIASNRQKLISRAVLRKFIEVIAS